MKELEMVVVYSLLAIVLLVLLGSAVKTWLAERNNKGGRREKKSNP